MAKKILKEKGVIITDDFVKQAKKKKVSELSVIKPVSKIKIIAGYALAVIVPVFGILIALSIIYNRNVLPNGEKFYVHSAADKREGELILIIGISSLCMMVVGYFVYH